LTDWTESLLTSDFVETRTHGELQHTPLAQACIPLACHDQVVVQVDAHQFRGEAHAVRELDVLGRGITAAARIDLESFNSITAGISYLPFLWTNRWKFSAEVGYLFDALNETIVEPSGSLGWLASDESGQTYFRIQAQFGF
jgi:hypothetical protein